jgi:hypothetical protein
MESTNQVSKLSLVKKLFEEPDSSEQERHQDAINQYRDQPPADINQHDPLSNPAS